MSWKAILGNGLLLPVSLLVAFDFALGEASRGKGGFEAAWLVIVGIAVVPGLLIANCWLFFVEWRSHWRVFSSGLALPAFMGAAQVLLLYGPPGPSRWGEALSSAHPWLLWVLPGLFFTPLLAVVARRLWRDRQ